MPTLGRLRRLIQGQGGSTLIELLVVMPLAVVALIAIDAAFFSTGRRHVELQQRTAAMTQAQVGLERMTRELRQANWVFVRSSQVIDLEVQVRPGASGASRPRLVRFDCTNASCRRLEGPETSFPPPATPAFETTRRLIGSPERAALAGSLVGRDVFSPQRIDPATGRHRPNFIDPDFVDVRVRLRLEGRRVGQFELRDGVAVRNRGTFA